MELDEFVTATLVGISKGVEEASKQLKDSTTIINPRNLSFNYSREAPIVLKNSIESEVPRLLEKIEFDVAVTVSDGTGTNGKIGISVGVLSLGSQGKSESSNSTISRIKFSVPMVLPNGDKTI